MNDNTAFTKLMVDDYRRKCDLPTAPIYYIPLSYTNTKLQRAALAGIQKRSKKDTSINSSRLDGCKYK